MTRDEIIRMARIAGAHDNGHEVRFVEPRYLARFVALVAAAKREPATHGEISEKFYNAGFDRYYRQVDYRHGWRAAERHHGIITKEDGK